MDFNPYATEDKQQKVRIIIATAAIAVIVLGIATWAIIAIVGSKDNTATTDQNTTVAVDDNTNANNTAKEPEAAPETEGVATETEPEVTVVHSTGEDTSANLPAPVITQESSVPTTGPEEILPFALIAGLFTTYLGSRKLAKVEA